MEDTGKNYKRKFILFFDGCYGFEAQPDTPSTYTMGVCKLEYKDNKLIVHLRRPGLLIGKGGRTIERIIKFLGIDIEIIEVSLIK